MMRSLRLRFAKWLLEPLEEERAEAFLRAMRQLEGQLQAGETLYVISDSGERHTIQ